MSFDRQLFSAAIQSRLLQKGLSVREAAAEAGVSASTISRLTGGEMPDIESFARLVNWLEADANQFIGNPLHENTLDDVWTGLYLCLQELEIPEELIKATVTILRLVAHSKQGGRP